MAAVLPPAGAGTAAGDARAEARRLQAAIRGVRAFVGRFTQIVESPGLPAPRIERGTMYLSRPGRVRFEYDEPEGKLAIADGKRAWLYTPEDRQVVVTPLRPGESGIGLLLDESVDVVREFSVDWDGGPDGDARLLRLTPRRRGAPFSHLLVEPGSGSFPSSIAVVDPLGGTVTYRFSLVRATDELDASLFRFVPPPGVEVQEITP